MFESRLELPGQNGGPFTVGAAWLVEVVTVDSGEICFESNDEKIRPASSRFGIYYSPYSIVRMITRDVRADCSGIGSFVLLPEPPRGPFIFEPEANIALTSVASALPALATARGVQRIDINPNASLLSIRAKRTIDENYRGRISISAIARRLRVSAEHLSRQFKRDFQFSPSKYLHRLRSMEASYKLSTGEPIIEISDDVGYNDLSRFYKQFRKNTNSTPGACRDSLAK